MPDEFEPPETEATENRKERRVGLIIAVIAVILAIVTHMGNEANNEKILAHVDASDQYAFYQAKKTRISDLQQTSGTAGLLRNLLPAAAQADADKMIAANEAEIKHLEEDNEKIKEKADDFVNEAKKLEKKAMFLELGEIGLQISIVLCSITILTEQSLFVRMGVAIGAVAAIIALCSLAFL